MQINKYTLGAIGFILLIMLGLYLLKGLDDPLNPSPRNNYPDQGEEQNDNKPPGPRDNIDLGETGYRGKDFIYTKHARCRMGCRKIDKGEVAYVLENGKINQRKSNPSDRPCPTYSYEARSDDGQMIRAVIAECDRSVKLITVIDLENNYRCNCK